MRPVINLVTIASPVMSYLVKIAPINFHFEIPTI